MLIVLYCQLFRLGIAFTLTWKNEGLEEGNENFLFVLLKHKTTITLSYRFLQIWFIQMNSMKHNSIYVQRIREFLTKLYIVGATPGHRDPGDGSLLSNSLHYPNLQFILSNYSGNI